jgi:hypothetical protein
LQALPTHDGWIDVSGYSLYQNPAPEAAFSNPPKSLTLNEAILAQLANTSSTEHGIPVNEYIRGRDSAYQVNLVVRKKEELDALVGMGSDELQNYVATALRMTDGETAKLKVDFVDEEYEDIIAAVLETSRPERYRAPCAVHTFPAGDIVCAELSE